MRYVLGAFVSFVRESALLSVSIVRDRATVERRGGFPKE
jgi:hypothetical protein